MAHAHFPWRPLGELLVEHKLVVESELEAALDEQRRTGRKLGELLVTQGAVTGSQLTRVLVEQAGLRLEAPEAAVEASGEPSASAAGEAAPWRPLGRVLVERGELAPADLEEALEVQRASGRRLGEILVERGYVTTQALVSAVIDQHGLADVSPGTTVATTQLATASEETYQVEDHASEEEVKVVFRTGAFLDAVDFAFEYLEAESPERLRIFRVLGRKREEVWAYDPEPTAAAEKEKPPRDLLSVYGYDVMRWGAPRT